MSKDLRFLLLLTVSLLITGCAQSNQPPVGRAQEAVAKSSSASSEKSEIQSVVNPYNPVTGRTDHLPVGTHVYALRGFVVRDGDREYSFTPPATYSRSATGLAVSYDGHVQHFSTTAYVTQSSSVTQYVIVRPGDSPPASVRGTIPVYTVK